MKLKIEKELLLKHINISQKAVSTKTYIQIHEMIYFSAKDNSLQLYSSDGELSIITTVPCIVEEEGYMIMNSSIIGNIIRKLPNGEITISANNEKITIKTAYSKLNVMTFDDFSREELPQISNSYIEIENEKLRRIINQTTFATSENDLRMELTGVNIEANLDELIFVSMDGYRIAHKIIKHQVPSEFSNLKVIVPKRALIELSRIIEEDKTTKIYLSKRSIVFKVDDTYIFTKIIEREFIDYKNFIKDFSNIKIIAKRSDLINALDRCCILAENKRANLVTCKIEEDKIDITSISQMGDSFESVKIKHMGDDLTISFNASYLLEGIRAINCDYIKLHFTDEITACFIYPYEEEKDEKFLYLVLPVRPNL